MSPPLTIERDRSAITDSKSPPIQALANNIFVRGRRCFRPCKLAGRDPSELALDVTSVIQFTRPLCRGIGIFQAEFGDGDQRPGSTFVIAARVPISKKSTIAFASPLKIYPRDPSVSLYPFCDTKFTTWVGIGLDISKSCRAY